MALKYSNMLRSSPQQSVNIVTLFDSPEREFQCVFITAVPITKLFARGGGGTMEDMCYERLRAEACVD
jgi:hypothetical protein